MRGKWSDDGGGVAHALQLLHDGLHAWIAALPACQP